MHKKQGFTLVEMLVVLGIMSLILVVAVPTTIGWLAKNKTRLSTQEFSMLLQRARVMAISGAQRTRVVVGLGNNPPVTAVTAWVEIKRGSAEWARIADITDVRTEITLAAGSVFKSGYPDPNPDVAIYFANDGRIVEKEGVLPMSEKTFVIENENGYQCRVRVKPSGRIDYIAGN